MSTTNWTIFAPPLPPLPGVKLSNPVIIDTIKSYPHLFKIITPINMDHFEDLLSAYPNLLNPSVRAFGTASGLQGPTHSQVSILKHMMHPSPNHLIPCGHHS